MIKFCRNCGKALADPVGKTCASCGSNAFKSTAFCRFCGQATSAGDAVCSNCGLAVRPISHGERALLYSHPRLVKAGKIVNLTIVVFFVSAYVIFSLPKAITKPIKATAADIVQASTGYSAQPLLYITSTPAVIPSLRNVGEVSMPPAFSPNETKQLTINAVFRASSSNNETVSTRTENVTGNCTYVSSNPAVAEVSTGGLVRATGVGAATITIYYIAAPGSANRSDSTIGKIPVTFNISVDVSVAHRAQELIEATYT